MRKLLILWIFVNVSINLILSAPKSWPYMKTYDIWSSDGNNTIDVPNGNTNKDTLQSSIDFKSKSHLGKSGRKSKGVFMTEQQSHLC